MCTCASLFLSSKCAKSLMPPEPRSRSKCGSSPWLTYAVIFAIPAALVVMVFEGRLPHRGGVYLLAGGGDHRHGADCPKVQYRRAPGPARAGPPLQRGLAARGQPHLIHPVFFVSQRKSRKMLPKNPPHRFSMARPAAAGPATDRTKNAWCAEAAAAYCQEKLAPRVLEAFAMSTPTWPSFARWASWACSAPPSPSNTAAPA